ncbi:zinc finger HIT domain-containing protein 3 isoform X2 [Ranitomeya variabilis]|uniref:zinc finger HIT domain-containing protein 3 isoform X2 n=1 Tax=Ranitomeya variabilis TaxID=490064 RepID=UPI00405662DC
MADPCCVCSVETAKYRCPHCRLRYCSLDCCRRHKEGCVPKEASRSSVAGVPDLLLTRGLSEELNSLLLNVHLRQLLVTLDQTENKDEALKQYMQEPLFVEFADKCLSLVDVEEKENLFSK